MTDTVDLQVSSSQLAAFLSLSRERVRQLRGDGLLPTPAKRGDTVSLRESVVAYVATLRRNDDSAMQLKQNRLRLLKAQAEKIEFENESERRLWWLASEVELNVGLVWHEVSRFLDTLPDALELKVDLPPAAISALQEVVDIERYKLAIDIENLSSTLDDAANERA